MRTAGLMNAQIRYPYNGLLPPALSIHIMVHPVDAYFLKSTHASHAGTYKIMIGNARLVHSIVSDILTTLIIVQYNNYSSL